MSEVPEQMLNARVFVSPQFHDQVMGLDLSPVDKVTVGATLARIAAGKFHPIMRPHVTPAEGTEPYVVEAHVLTVGRGDLLIEAVKLTDSPVLLTGIAPAPGT